MLMISSPPTRPPLHMYHHYMHHLAVTFQFVLMENDLMPHWLFSAFKLNLWILTAGACGKEYYDSRNDVTWSLPMLLLAFCTQDGDRRWCFVVQRHIYIASLNTDNVIIPLHPGRREPSGSETSLAIVFALNLPFIRCVCGVEWSISKRNAFVDDG